MRGRKLYKGSHWVSRGGFHFIFKTKDHEPLFKGNIVDEIKNGVFVLKEKHGIVDLIVRVFPYHIHLFVAPLRKTSPLAFGQEALQILGKIVYKHYGMSNVFDEDFYSATIDEVSPEFIDKLLEKL